MKLTKKTFSNIIRTLKGCYPTWNIGGEPIIFMNNWVELIPEELADEMVRVYRQRRAKGPESAVDFVNAYIENQIENARSVGEVIDKIVSGINHYYEYEVYESSYSDCDEYITQFVIPMFPCPLGVKAFYDRNSYYLDKMARFSPEPDEWKSIYNKLAFDYRDQLIIVERNSINKMINHTALPTGTQNEQLEA